MEVEEPEMETNSGIINSLRTDRSGENEPLFKLKFLREFCGDDEGRMLKYINMFLNYVPSDILRIENAMQAGDYKTLKTVMHSLKPHFNFMGMQETRTKADQVEELIINGQQDTGQLAILVQSIIDDCEASIKKWG
jgi:HPt (histidine-containing phosphotransfer) domain-containing protein